MKKFVLLMFSVLFICTLSAPAFAVADEDVTTVTEFSYIIVDEDKNIVSSGVIPPANARYSWPSVILQNNQTAYFRKTDGTNFYILEGTRVSYELTKDREGYVTTTFYETNGPLGTGGYVAHSSNAFGVRYSSSFIVPEPRYGVSSGYYMFGIKSASSDPITITSISMTF